LTSGGGGEGTRDTAIPAALPELAAEAAPLLLLLLLLLLELARGVCCGEQSLTTGNLASKNPKTSDKIFYNAQHHASASYPTRQQTSTTSVVYVPFSRAGTF
jgi:hypothetical protein